MLMSGQHSSWLSEFYWINLCSLTHWRGSFNTYKSYERGYSAHSAENTQNQHRQLLRQTTRWKREIRFWCRTDLIECLVTHSVCVSGQIEAAVRRFVVFRLTPWKPPHAPAAWVCVCRCLAADVRLCNSRKELKRVSYLVIWAFARMRVLQCEIANLLQCFTFISVCVCAWVILQLEMVQWF